MANNDTDQLPPCVLVNRVSEQAVFPSGFILSTPRAIFLPPQKTQVPTDLRFTLPFGVAFSIVPIPDLARKSISFLERYIGPCTDTPVSVTIHNPTGYLVELQAGDQFAQLQFSGRIAPEFVDVTPRIDH